MTQRTRAPATPLCRLVDVSHAFGPVRALERVSLELRAGEILCIVGENGAGKSTLMSVLYGLLQPDAGHIEFGGRTVRLRSARDAIERGLGMVHQHFMLYPELSVLENVIVGAEGPGRLGLIDFRRRRAEVAALLARFSFGLDPDRPVRDLAVDARQQLEIVKLLYRRADLIILDEPTAVLTPQEIEALFAMLRRLRDEGKSIIVITHKLGEVMALSDRVAVMRRGRRVAERRTTDTDRDELSTLMVDGRVETLSRQGWARERTTLQVGSLSVSGEHGKPLVDNVSLSVRAGEILGIAGVANNGQQALVEALVGLRSMSGGHIVLNGRDIGDDDIGARRAAGLGYLAEDRMRVGLALSGSIAENALAGMESRPAFSRAGWLDVAAAKRHAAELIARFDIRTSGPRQPVARLSGGNKQKVIVARELAAGPSLIIAENPCWGVDVGAIAFIHRQLMEAARDGAAILLISSDLDELFALSDRLAVFYDGRISAQFTREQLDVRTVGAAMSGRASGAVPATSAPVSSAAPA